MQNNKPTLKDYVTTGFMVFDSSKPLSTSERKQMEDLNTFNSMVKIGANELITNNPKLDFDLCCDMLKVYLFYVREYNGVH